MLCLAIIIICMILCVEASGYYCFSSRKFSSQVMHVNLLCRVMHPGTILGAHIQVYTIYHPGSSLCLSLSLSIHCLTM